MRNVEDFYDQAKQLVRDHGFGDGYLGFSSEDGGQIAIINLSGEELQSDLWEELFDLAASYGLTIYVE